MIPPVRALLAVLSVDVAATSVLIGVAVRARARARARPSATAYRRVAAVAVASLLPGMIAVGREVRAHGSGAETPHRMRPTVLLLLGGLLVNTAGTLLVLPSTRSVAARGSAAQRADLLLLVGGDLIGVPYLTIVSALHRSASAFASRRPPRGRPRPRGRGATTRRRRASR